MQSVRSGSLYSDSESASESESDSGSASSGSNIAEVDPQHLPTGPPPPVSGYDKNGKWVTCMLRLRGGMESRKVHKAVRQLPQHFLKHKPRSSSSSSSAAPVLVKPSRFIASQVAQSDSNEALDRDFTRMRSFEGGSSSNTVPARQSIANTSSGAFAPLIVERTTRALAPVVDAFDPASATLPPHLQRIMDADLEDSDFANMAGYLPMWSESTVRKHAYSERMYDVVHLKASTHPELAFEKWKLNPAGVQVLMMFLASKTKLCLPSILSVVIPSLKRIGVQRGHQHTPQEMSAITNTIRECSRAIRIQFPYLAKKQNACTIQDVAQLIKDMPDGMLHKPREACLYLTAVHTGARAKTIANLLWGDITSGGDALDPDIEDLQLLKFLYRVTKGDDHWNWPMTLAGFIDANVAVDINRDAVYWWNQYTLEEFGVAIGELKAYIDTHPELQKVRVFGGDEDALRNRFSTRVTLSGYPQRKGAVSEAFFSFHNLRAGFITTAYLRAGGSEVAEEAVLERTGLQAGWAPHSQSQLGYVKRAAIRNSIASALVNPGLPFVDRHVVNDPVRFHELSGPLAAKYPDAYHSQYIVHHVLKFIREKLDIYGSDDRNLYNYVLREYMSSYVQKPHKCTTSGYNALCNAKFVSILKNPLVSRVKMAEMVDFMKYLCEYVLNTRRTIFRRTEVVRFIELCDGSYFDKVADTMNQEFFLGQKGEKPFTGEMLERLDLALLKKKVTEIL